MALSQGGGLSISKSHRLALGLIQAAARASRGIPNFPIPTFAPVAKRQGFLSFVIEIFKAQATGIAKSGGYRCYRDPPPSDLQSIQAPTHELMYQCGHPTIHCYTFKGDPRSCD
jgi:hypothetical protein